MHLLCRYSFKVRSFCLYDDISRFGTLGPDGHFEFLVAYKILAIIIVSTKMFGIFITYFGMSIHLPMLLIRVVDKHNANAVL